MFSVGRKKSSAVHDYYVKDGDLFACDANISEDENPCYFIKNCERT